MDKIERPIQDGPGINKSGPGHAQGSPGTAQNCPDITQNSHGMSLSETNYNKASFFYHNNSFISAEKLLLENIEKGTDDEKIFDMLVNIYSKSDNYQKLIKTLDIAVKRCAEKRKEYRELKKAFILEQIFKDIGNSRSPKRLYFCRPPEENYF